MAKLFIPVLVATAREGRESIKVAKYVTDQLSAYKPEKVETELIDVKDYLSEITVPSWEPNEMTKKWSAVMTKADGLVVIVPEYNHGYPGELKIFLDGIYDEYNRKPAIACGVSGGGLGGTRGVDHISHVLSALGMATITKSGYNVFFSGIKELFDADGNMTDDKYPERLTKMFDELTWYAAALKAAR